MTLVTKYPEGVTDLPPRDENTVLYTDVLGTVEIRGECVANQPGDVVLHEQLTRYRSGDPRWAALVHVEGGITVVTYSMAGLDPLVEIIDCDNKVEVKCFGRVELNNRQVYGALREWAQMSANA